ncbi:DUF1543 domain-containing protein [Parasynechococcus sp.]|uniref:DUF1543 domain-containing protein n=1 Tax=Parasynechococcus sp. TaxID=3101203 RepID=UPI003703FD3D
MKLFLVVLGGRLPGCHLECHDVRWVAAENLASAIPELKRQWIGPQKGLHLDSYCQVNVIDGHQIKVRSGPMTTPSKPMLWFVNLGAYHADELAERHQFGLVVANNRQAAAMAAKRRWLVGLDQVHTDDLFSMDSHQGVDACLPIDGQGHWHVQLTPTATAANDSGRPDWYGYRPI